VRVTAPRLHVRQVCCVCFFSKTTQRVLALGGEFARLQVSQFSIADWPIFSRTSPIPGLNNLIWAGACAVVENLESRSRGTQCVVSWLVIFSENSYIGYSMCHGLQATSRNCERVLFKEVLLTKKESCCTGRENINRQGSLCTGHRTARGSCARTWAYNRGSTPYTMKCKELEVYVCVKPFHPREL
jgi:hypothetical protein